MKSTYHVFGKMMIDSNLAAYTAVMCQNRCRHLNKSDSPHIRSGYKSCQIPNDSAAERNYDRATIKSAFNRSGHYFFKHLQ
ncbi:hypothetical protein D3C76_1203300 [compost metagenome]